MKKVYISSEDTATLICPHCEKTKVIDTSKYKERQGPVKIKFTFKCRQCYCGKEHAIGCNGTDCKKGHTMVALLERRKYYRKKVNFPGEIIDARKNVTRVNVRDISKKGLLLQIRTPKTFDIGEILTVVFTLDDPQNSEIKKNVVVQKMLSPDLIGVEFTSSDNLISHSDKAIGFYLRS